MLRLTLKSIHYLHVPQPCLPSHIMPKASAGWHHLHVYLYSAPQISLSPLMHLVVVYIPLPTTNLGLHQEEKVHIVLHVHGIGVLVAFVCSCGSKEGKPPPEEAQLCT
jgi:hypothetical protein